VADTDTERHGVPVVASRGVDVLFPPADEYLRVVGALRDEGFDLCVDITAVDFLTHPGRPLPGGVTPERYEVVVNLLSLERRERVRVRVQVADGDPTVPSLFGLYPGTETPEREVFDMFGIAFDGHPDLTRILMPEDWEGHPLRKDFAIGRIPVQFKATGGTGR
jgi:NADH-quinone oxidoreductase subunit C